MFMFYVYVTQIFEFCIFSTVAPILVNHDCFVDQTGDCVAHAPRTLHNTSSPPYPALYTRSSSSPHHPTQHNHVCFAIKKTQEKQQQKQKQEEQEQQEQQNPQEKQTTTQQTILFTFQQKKTTPRHRSRPWHNQKRWHGLIRTSKETTSKQIYVFVGPIFIQIKRSTISLAERAIVHHSRECVL